MFIYIYIYIYTYCKLDHLSPFMLLMINICRPDLLNCFWIMPREKKSVQVEMVAFGKVHHLQLCSLNNSPTFHRNNRRNRQTDGMP